MSSWDSEYWKNIYPWCGVTCFLLWIIAFLSSWRQTKGHSVEGVIFELMAQSAFKYSKFWFFLSSQLKLHLYNVCQCFQNKACTLCQFKTKLVSSKPLPLKIITLLLRSFGVIGKGLTQVFYFGLLISFAETLIWLLLPS